LRGYAIQSRIAHFNLRIRTPQESPAVLSAVLSLERIARERIAEVCGRAFEETFQNDPSVFVVRSVHAKVAVLASHATLESRLAEQLGARLCASVVRVIAGPSNHENVVRFENCAEFVSNFLTDYVAGTVWDHWYYGAFFPYRGLPSEEAVLDILIENLDYLGEILHRLTRANALSGVLAALGADGQRRLWLRVATQSSGQLSEDAVLIFVQTAFRLIDSLALWASSRPSEQDTCRDYLLSQPASPQWTTPSSLTSAVLEVLRFLRNQGLLLVPHSFAPDQLDKLDAVLNASCDWLDRSHLKNSLLAILAPVTPQSSMRASTLRPSLLTPAQVQLLRSLLLSIREQFCALDPIDRTPHAHLLRLLAALAAAEPSVNLAHLPVLESIVETWLALRDRAQSDADLLALRRGQTDSLLAYMSPAEKNHLRPHFHSVANAGEPAIALLEELLTQYPAKTSSMALNHFNSNCAGLFLLVRTVQDLRLAALLKEAGFPSLEPLLVALSLRIAGISALQDGTLDPGAALWSGIGAEGFANLLPRLTTLDPDCFRQKLSELIAAQGIVDPISSPEFALQPPSLDLPREISSVIEFSAVCLLHAWARWLPGLSGSSIGFVLDKFISRAGALHLYADRIDVTLSPGPLDAILKMAGYLSDSPTIPWLGNRFVRFRAASQERYGNHHDS
jgi:hypothetical protein